MVKDGNPDAQGLIDYNEFIQRMLAVKNQSVHRPALVRIKLLLRCARDMNLCNR